MLQAIEERVRNVTEFPYWHPASLHWLSSTYLLSATHSDGRRVRFDHVARIENFAADFASVMADLGVAADNNVRPPECGMACSTCRGQNVSNGSSLFLSLCAHFSLRTRCTRLNSSRAASARGR